MNTESNLYRLNGLDKSGELAYNFRLEQNTRASYYSVTRFKHSSIPFVQVHFWSGDEQSQGLFFNTGIRYNLEFFGLRSNRIK